MSEWNEIRRPFREALISAFNWNSLSRVLLFHCDLRLDRITAESKGFDTNVDDVIEDAVRNGWLEKLAKGALEENELHSGLNATAPVILKGIEDFGRPYYQGNVFEESRREKTNRGTGTGEGSSTQPIIYQVSGDLVYGDKREGDDIEVGSISGSEGVAIGRFSSASVEESTPVERHTDEPTGSTRAGGPEPDVQELHQRLVDQFNVEELQDLCFALGVDYEELGGMGKSAKARELVLYMQRRGRLVELSEAIRAKRG